MNALAALLGSDDFLDDEDDAPTILPEAARDRMVEAHERIMKGCKFMPGDFVTVRKDAPVRGNGIPMLVIDTNPDAPLYQGEAGYWSFATRSDVTVLRIHDDCIVPHAVPHWMLETYEFA